MTSRAALLIALSLVACRKRTENAVAPAVSAPIVDSAPEAPPAVEAPKPTPPPPPPPTAPAVACTPDPHLRFKQAPMDLEHLEPTPHAGPAGLACSPFVTAGSSELTMAPGTFLQISMDAEESVDGAFDDLVDVTYATAGLPKLAWVDPATRTFKWKVAGADGDVLAFSVATVKKAGPQCVTASYVIRVRDDDATRRAQAMWLNREESVGAVLRTFYPFSDSPQLRELARKIQCGASPIAPVFRDADGDGLADALFGYPSPGGGNAAETDVWLRRGETFAKVGRATGRPERAADGTTFVVDTTSAGTGFACTLGVKIFQVFKNRVQLVVDESSEASVDLTGVSCAPGDGITIDRVGPDLLGFTDQGTPAGGKPRRRVWRWDGKRFTRAP